MKEIVDVNICKRCGKENQEHYKFCLGCGGELTSSAPAGGGGQKTVMATALPPGAFAGLTPGGGGMGPTTAQGPAAAPPHGTSPTPPAGMPAVSAQPGYGSGPVSPVMPAAHAQQPPPLGPPPHAHSAPPSSAGGAPFGGGPAQYGAAPPPSTSPPFSGLAPSPAFGAPPGQSPYAGGPTGGPAKSVMAGAGPTTPTGSQGQVPPPAGWGPAASPYGAPQPAPVFTPPAPSSPLYSPPAPSVSSAPPTGSQPVAPVGASRVCSNCGTEVPASFAFCGACGNRLDVVPGISGRTGVTGEIAAARVAPVAEPKPRGRLTLIRPDGSEGGTHDLEEGENQIGRSHGSLFENDGYLSPRHAEIIVNAAGAVIRDLDSLNGVFVKMTGEEELSSGDVFRIGQELLRFDAIAPPAPLEDGTEIMGSPNPGYWGRLSVIIGKEIDGSAFPLFGDSMAVGRERGDINFPDDGYVSGVHARIVQRDGKCFITDLNSSNGTFVRLRGERIVQDGAFVLFGQQLFRVNLNVG